MFNVVLALARAGLFWTAFTLAPLEDYPPSGVYTSAGLERHRPSALLDNFTDTSAVVSSVHAGV
jgi:hypothetical protein